MKCILKFVFGGLLYFVFCNPANAQNNYTLQKALQTARANNPYLKSEQFNIGIAQTDIITAKLYPNPILENEQYYLPNPQNLIPGTDLFNPQNTQMLIKYMQPIPVSGQRKNKITLAKLNFEISKYEYAEFERNLYFEVANKWQEAWIAQKRFDIIQFSKNNIDSLLLINKIRYKNQTITQTELYRMELLAKQYALQLINAKQEVINHLNELKFLLGVDDNVMIDLSDSEFILSTSEQDSSLQYALSKRSDVQQSRLLMDASAANINLQKSLSYPEIQLGFVFSPQNGISYLGPSFTFVLPIFDRNQGEIKKSYLLKEQANSRFNALLSKIQTEFSVAYNNYKLHQNNLKNYDLLLQQSQTILDNVKYAYTKGATTIIDFLEAQRSWLEIQQQYYEAVHQYRNSYIQLLYVTGLINQLAQ